MSSLKLDPDLQQQYRDERNLLDIVRGAAAAQGDAETLAVAESDRRGLDRKFRQLQAARGPKPPTALELENRMSVEQRIDRIEQHLCLGRYHPEFDHG